MKIKIYSSGLATLLLAVSLILCAANGSFGNSSSKSFPLPANDPPEIIFASDTQQPIWLETLFLKENQNEKATEMIFTDIISRNPAALFLLGDVVSKSCRESCWENMDTYLADCKNQCIPYYAQLGNHEYLFNAKTGEQNFRTRFPESVETGYVEVVDSIAVILLNSNFTKLTKAQFSSQQKFYAKTLAALDADPAVQFIIVACHHSPYSNSKIVGSSESVQQNFVPLFIKSRKCVLFISGHSHNFEYFRKEGKDFLVIGGGGGLHQPLDNDSGELIDLAPDYKPMFHYLTVKKFPDRLQVTSRRLTDDFSRFEDGFVIDLHKLVASK